jgi:hypothetical protein
MITSTVSFRVAPGKNLEANEYFRTELRILNQLGGPMGHFVLSATYDTLAEWDQSRQKLQNDVPFQKLVAQAGNDGLFIPGHVESAIWQHVQ